MTRFFVPGMETLDDANDLLLATRTWLEDQTQWAIIGDPLFRIAYQRRRDRGVHVAEVGRSEPLEGKEEVLLILETEGNGPYLVCTATRGVIRGLPYLVGRQEVTELVPFTD